MCIIIYIILIHACLSIITESFEIAFTTVAAEHAYRNGLHDHGAEQMTMERMSVWLVGWLAGAHPTPIIIHVHPTTT